MDWGLSFIKDVLVPVESDLDELDDALNRIGNPAVMTEARIHSVKEIRDLLASQHRLEVGRKALPVLMDALASADNDTDLAENILETLCVMFGKASGSTSTSAAQQEQLQDDPYAPEQLRLQTQAAMQLTNEFIDTSDEYLALVLSFLASEALHVRYYAIQVLTELLGNNNPAVQDALLRASAVNTVVDVLGDKELIVRNEGLVLLREFTLDNPEIQKVVVFEGTFDKLLDIIEIDGFLEGGIIVNDCLRLMVTLLEDNALNLMQFRDNGRMAKLVSLLSMADITEEDVRGDDLLADNLLVSLCLVSLLVSGDHASIADNQQDMVRVGLLEHLVELAVAKSPSQASAAIRTQAVWTLANVLRANADAQQMYLNATVHAGLRSQSATLALLQDALRNSSSSELGEPDGFAAAAYAFKCLMENNSAAQQIVADAMVHGDGGDAQDNISVGPLLLDALLQWESGAGPVGCFFASDMICSVLQGNADVQIMLLEPRSVGGTSGTLIDQVTRELIKAQRVGGHVSVQIALLKVICVSMHKCPKAVDAFLSSLKHFTFLVDVVKQTGLHPVVLGLASLALGICLDSNKDNGRAGMDSRSLFEIIRQQLGQAEFLDRLEQLEAHPSCSGVLKETSVAVSPIMLVEESFEPAWFDTAYAAFVKACLESINLRILSLYSAPSEGPGTSGNNEAGASSTAGQGGSSHTDDEGEVDSAEVRRLRDLVRSRDEELQALQRKNLELKRKADEAQEALENAPAAAKDDSEQYQLKRTLREARAELDVAKMQQRQSEDKVVALSQEVNTLKSQLEESVPKSQHEELEQRLKTSLGDYDSMSDMYVDLERTFNEQAAELEALREAGTQAGADQSTSTPGPVGSHTDEEWDALVEQLEEAKKQAAAKEEQAHDLEVQLGEERNRVQEARSETIRLQSQLGTKQEELDSLNQEFADMLEILADDEERIHKLEEEIKVLKEQGANVDDVLD